MYVVSPNQLSVLTTFSTFIGLSAHCFLGIEYQMLSLLMDDFSAYHEYTPKMTEIYRPVIYSMSLPDAKEELTVFRDQNPDIQVHDAFLSQVKEFIKCSNPSLSFDESNMQEAIEEYLEGKTPEDSGSWVYYPWSKKLVHLLEEIDFIKVRTDRNLYKIKPEEQKELSSKKIGLMGLSVGHAVALTLALERSFGELRIADFDELDLSNLNRIRSTVYNLGVNKTAIVAREIAELDPYLKVVCYQQGIWDDNIDDFLHGLDILIDECDSIDMKIIAREKARSQGIPVVMETSDRGMLDIERYDKDRQLPILHGLVKDLKAEDLKGLSNEEKIPYVLPILGLTESSLGIRMSMFEIERSIATWPQLGSDVILGGGSTSQVVRRILIGKDIPNGRYYVDMDELVPEKIEPTQKNLDHTGQDLQIDRARIIEQVERYMDGVSRKTAVPVEFMQSLIVKASKAPSGGNTQPWLWNYSNDHLFLFLDTRLPRTLYNFRHRGSLMAFGAASLNIELSAAQEFYGVETRLISENLHKDFPLVVAYRIFPMKKVNDVSPLFKFIESRITNRLNDKLKPLPSRLFENLNSAHTQKAQVSRVQIIDRMDKIQIVKEVLAISDKLMMLNTKGHTDLYGELAWQKDYSESQGINVNSLGLTSLEMAGMEIAKDKKVVESLREVNGGDRFREMNMKCVDAAGAFGLFIVPDFEADTYFKLGIEMQNLWLYCTSIGISFHPMSGILFLIQRANLGDGKDFSKLELQQVKKCEALLRTAFDIQEGETMGFLFRIYHTDSRPKRSNRKSLSQITITNDHEQPTVERLRTEDIQSN
ncbi:MAG: Rv1355c family protein [Flavobacteriales bacterium]|nr:Rv1355c family protein [Flavobacteriales bacterium]